jgi:hypothetical protein
MRSRNTAQPFEDQTMFRLLSTDRFAAPASEFRPGPAPQLQWIEIDQLVVDPAYQRDIGRRGATNVKQIAEKFDWSKFAPVIVAPVEGGLFAIVDGQHRTTAAILRGLKAVPCQTVQADRAKQAEAFAAVNGNVTKTNAQQLFHARLAAGDEDARRLAQVCAAGGVEITRRNFTQKEAKLGQTQAVSALIRCLDRYGDATLITALQCVTQTGDGNPGFLRATIIEALCEVLQALPKWREAGDALLKAMDDFEFADAWERAMVGRNFVLSPVVRQLLVEELTNHLNRKADAERAQKPRKRG